MYTIIIIAVFILILIMPVKIAANYVGAKNTGIFMCLIALIFAAIIQESVSSLVPLLAVLHPAVNILVSLLLSAFAYMLVLGTTYGKSIAIALMQIILTFFIIFLLGLLGLSITAFL